MMRLHSHLKGQKINDLLQVEDIAQLQARFKFTGLLPLALQMSIYTKVHECPHIWYELRIAIMD